jgi:hypothetical protein
LSFYHICYSTASSTKEHPKFRLVIPLSRDVLANEIDHFWFCLSKHLNIGIDEQTKDKSRMFYVPALYKGAFNFIWTTKGPVLNVDDIKSKFDFVKIKQSDNMFDLLPKDIQDKILERKKSKLSRSVQWYSYKDCPFVNKKLIDDFSSIARIDGTGRYSKIYSIMCSIASNAIKHNYDLSAQELVTLIKEIDLDTSNKYQKRKLDVEAKNALSFAYNKI